MKIRIFQPIVPEYRVALFNGVGKRYGADVEVWASEGEGEDRSYPLESMRFDYAHPFVKCGPIRWQRGLSLRGLARGDVIVICGDVHQLSSLWIAAQARGRGIRVVWWGHHLSVGSRTCAVQIRLLLTRLLSDVVLCYTKQGVDWFAARGWKAPVFATGNTMDMAAVKQAIAAWSAERLLAFQRKHGLVNQEAIIFCSVLRRKTHLDLLLKVMSTAEMKRRNTLLVVIGDGECRMAWERLSCDLGVSGRVIWAGALRDQMKIAPWFLSAKAYVYPGAVGLSLIHAFSYGLPVICHGNGRQHGPEFEAMADGLTGYVFKENDISDCARQIVRLLEDEPKRRGMAEFVQHRAYANYGIETMVSNYCRAVDKAASISEGE